MSRAAERPPDSPNSLNPPTQNPALRPSSSPLLLPSPLPAAYTAVARAHSRCCVAEKPM